MTENETLEQSASLAAWEQKDDDIYHERMIAFLDELAEYEYTEWMRENVL